jgi:IMP dehydrogenase/GMP reductase
MVELPQALVTVVLQLSPHSGTGHPQVWSVLQIWPPEQAPHMRELPQALVTVVLQLSPHSGTGHPQVWSEPQI